MSRVGQGGEEAEVVTSAPGEEKTVQLYFIQDSRSYLGDAVVWWCPEGKGYTVDIEQAGLFDEAGIRGLRDTDVVWPEEVILEARKVAVVMIGQLDRGRSFPGGKLPRSRPEEP